MSVMKRVSLIFRAKADKALDRMEDPRETLDYSYKQQVEMLTRVRRGVADVATSRKRVELQMNSLQKELAKRENQARNALGVGREDLARAALQQKGQLQQQLDDLQGQYSTLQEQEEKLTMASQRLDTKVQAFRTRKETIKATYTAAEAQTRINEAFSGISEEMGDVGLAIQRAEDKTAQMQARAGAIDELLASGALEDHVGGPGSQDYIQAELDRIGGGNDIESELARMRGELASGAPKQLEANGDGSANGASSADVPAPVAEKPQAGEGL
jgi:phage shock protein A